jgi:hypothetical protein
MSEELTQANVSKRFIGHIHGGAAKRYPNYIYCVPEEPGWSRSPWLEDRIIYPERRLPRPELAYLKTVELADYLIEVGKMDIQGTQTVEVFLTPNQFTLAVAPRLVFRVFMHVLIFEQMEEGAFLDWVLGKSFKTMEGNKKQ